MTLKDPITVPHMSYPISVLTGDPQQYPDVPGPRVTVTLFL